MLRRLLGRQAPNDDWVFDSVVGFLVSPKWTVPIEDFCDVHCLIFDTEEENKFAYTDVHNEYQALVERILESFLAELGIDHARFVQVLATHEGNGRIREDVFAAVTAVDDFLVFKRIMVRKNIELEAMAREQLTRGGGGIASSSSVDSGGQNSSFEDSYATVPTAQGGTVTANTSSSTSSSTTTTTTATATTTTTREIGAAEAIEARNDSDLAAALAASAIEGQREKARLTALLHAEEEALQAAIRASLLDRGGAAPEEWQQWPTAEEEEIHGQQKRRNEQDKAADPPPPAYAPHPPAEAQISGGQVVATKAAVTAVAAAEGEGKKKKKKKKLSPQPPKGPKPTKPKPQLGSVLPSLSIPSSSSLQTLNVAPAPTNTADTTATAAAAVSDKFGGANAIADTGTRRSSGGGVLVGGVEARSTLVHGADNNGVGNGTSTAEKGLKVERSRLLAARKAARNDRLQSYLREQEAALAAQEATTAGSVPSSDSSYAASDAAVTTSEAIATSDSGSTRGKGIIGAKSLGSSLLARIRREHTPIKRRGAPAKR